MRATLPRMETDEGTYRQELAAWRRSVNTTARYFPCPWPECRIAQVGQAQLHGHLDACHEGKAP